MSDDESMTAMLAKIKKKADEERKTADRKPASVEEAEEIARKLEEDKDRMKQHMTVLSSVKVNDDNRKEYQEAAAAIEQAYTSVKQGIERSKTVVEASRVVPRRKRKVIQVAFLLDATGSMTCGAIIDNVKSTITQLCTHLGSVSSLDTAVGFVAYRDYNDTTRFEKCDFTSNTSEFITKLSAVKAEGGGDEAEDVLGGFDQVINHLSWGPRNETIHVVVFMGDAPGHGLWDRAGPIKIGDHHPEGDKFGLTVEKVCAKLLQQNITLAFLKVNAKTDYMIKLFDREMTNGGMAVIQEQYQDVASCRDSVERLLFAASSVSCTTGTTTTAGGGGASGGKVVKRDVPKKEKTNFDPEKAKIKGTLMVQQSMALSATSALKVAMDLLRARSAKELNLRETSQTEMVIEVPWFSCGGVRFAHIAHFNTDKVVAKDFQWGDDDVMRHLDEFRSTLIAQALAFLFCSKLSINPEKFSYVQSQIFVASSGTPAHPHLVKHYSVETFVEGEFIKFNSNGGYVNAAYEMAQAFSHFTYHVCDGKLMVLDLQGWFDNVTKKYLLTDPALVTEDYSLLPTATNMGKDAMHDFLKVHKCGPLCQSLGTPNINPGAATAGTRR